jgi:hypothetical protein
MPKTTTIVRALLAITLASSSACALDRGTSPAPPGAVKALGTPAWASGARMVDLIFHESFPASADDVQNDLVAIHGLIDDAAAAGASIAQLHFSHEFLYSDWIDDAGFAKNRDALADAAAYAHGKGLRVIVYMNALEVMSPGVNPAPSPAQGFDDRRPSIRRDHPDWLQTTPQKKPIWLTGIKDDEGVDYVQGPDWEDAWLCPLSGYRKFFLARVDAVMKAGADGVFVDVAFLPGLPGVAHAHLGGTDEHLVGCYNVDCEHAFTAKNPGHALPSAAEHLDWNSDTWRRWVRFRYATIRDYYADIGAAVRAVKPDGLAIAETSANDVPGDAIDFGNDNTQCPIALAPEMTPILPETGECTATIDPFVSFFTRAKYHRAINRAHGNAFVGIGSAIADEEAAIQFGTMAATGGSYFTFDRTLAQVAPMFAFLKAHAQLATSVPAARAAVLFSPHTRDFVDRISGDLVDTSGAPHFAAYRRATTALENAHVPFEIVFPEDATAAELARYDLVIAPETRCMSAEAAARLRAYATSGKVLIPVGEVATLDLWGQPGLHDIGVAPIAATADYAAAVASAASAKALAIGMNGHDLDSSTPVLVDAMRADDGSSLIHLVNLSAALKVSSTCEMPAAPIANVELEIPCAALARCEAPKVTVYGFEPRGALPAAVLAPTKGAASVHVTLPSLSAYALVVID